LTINIINTLKLIICPSSLIYVEVEEVEEVAKDEQISFSYYL
jgi:hypothetical protein